jgi:pilus assembly protein CpaD
MSKVPSRSRPTARATALLALFVLPLGACAGKLDRVVNASQTIPDDYRQRHPIVLTNSAQTLDIFPGGAGGLDARQAKNIQAFVRDYKSAGQGTMQVLLPRGAGQGSGAAQATLAAVRKALLQNGMSGYINAGSYEVTDPSLAAPLRLSFTRLKAKLATNCGDWPADLASGSSNQGWDNRPYYNLGCATQQNLAQQVSDPRDLVEPRAEDPSDVQMRTRAIGFIRKGEDPSTIWLNGNSHIGNLGN